MRLFRKKKSMQDEKVLAEASKLAADRLQQYISERRSTDTATTNAPAPLKKTISLTRLGWW